MRALLGTQAFLWFVLGDSKHSAAARAAIIDPANEVLISPASFWELAIKISLGKYSLIVPFETFWQSSLDGNGFRILQIELRHAAVLASLPFHHKDPFDRLLVAQAKVDDLSLVSSDSEVDAYGIRRIW